MPLERSAAEIYGRDFPAGAVVFEQSLPGSRMRVVISGAVWTEKQVGERNRTLAVPGAEEAFFELARLENAPRSATDLVEGAARIPEIGDDALVAHKLHRSLVWVGFLRRLSARLRETNRAALRDLADNLDLARRFDPEQRARSTP